MRHEPPTVAAAPRTADALSGDCARKMGAVNDQAVPLLQVAGTLGLVSAVAWQASMQNAQWRPPNAQVWLELAFALALGGMLNLLLAAVTHLTDHVSKPRVGPTAVLALGASLLCVPYVLPFRFGTSASGLALVLFIGVWKALDALGGTQPPAISRGGLLALVMHYASPVEYKVERTADGFGAIMPARHGLWMSELAQTATSYLSLSLATSARSVFLSSGFPALALYAEVWVVYLFLALFTGTFATLLALAGFHPMQTFDSPLLRSTSISDFWSRRWNLLIHGLFRRSVFRPLLRRGFPPWAAGGLAFAISGAFHEYAFALHQPDQWASLGRCLLFFLVQAPVVSLEKFIGTKFSVPWPFKSSAAACTLAWTILLVPFAPLFLHPLKKSSVFDQIFELVPRLA